MNPQYAEMLGLGSANEGLDNQMAKQQMMAKMLQGASSPGMRGNGRVQVAPGALESLTSIGAGAMQGHGMNQQAALAGQKTANRQQQMALLLRMLQEKDQPPAAGPAGPGMTPPGPPQGMNPQPPPPGY